MVNEFAPTYGDRFWELVVKCPYGCGEVRKRKIMSYLPRNVRDRASLRNPEDLARRDVLNSMSMHTHLVHGLPSNTHMCTFEKIEVRAFYALCNFCAHRVRAPDEAALEAGKRKHLAKAHPRVDEHGQVHS